MTAPVDQPSRKRTRWAVASVCLLVAAYPATEGPASYLIARRWLPRPAFDAIYAPVWAAVEDSRLERPHDRYVWWWEALGYRHEGYVVRSLGGTRVLTKRSAEPLRVR